MLNCLNCNAPLTSTQKFCGECGQKTALKRVNLHDVLHDAIHYFTHADKGIFTLLKSLVLFCTEHCFIIALWANTIGPEKPKPF